jgi:hypothetical protein
MALAASTVVVSMGSAQAADPAAPGLLGADAGKLPLVGEMQPIGALLTPQQ